MQCNSSWERGVIICERNNSVSEEGGGRGALGTKAEIPLSPVVKTLGTQVVALQSMKDCGGADIHPVAHAGLHAKAGSCALKEAAVCGKLVLEQVPGRTYNLWRGAHRKASFLAGSVTQ
ncbi:hypothetical protein llap_3836 [Limosa lapponica baueri]|uniref:Uncharacterized protein n=1 Tax=Limosa lapponica baueri TaxID=1758121 RepID=A0A2I0UIF7_LIMLA|nr:hypothetical protein llap_3836 [Limosa lapponica baueri]